MIRLRCLKVSGKFAISLGVGGYVYCWVVITNVVQLLIIERTFGLGYEAFKVFDGPFGLS
jgi:hypothetical protein